MTTLTGVPTGQHRLSTTSRALRYLPATAFTLDACLVVLSAALGAIARQTLELFDAAADVTGALTVAGPLTVLGWMGCILFAGGYSRSVFDAGADEYKRVVRASLVAAGLFGVGCYVAKYPLPRGFFLLTFAIGIPALVVGRLVLRRFVYAARRRGSLLHRVIIAGSPAHVDEVAAVLAREAWLGYSVIGALTPAHHTLATTRSGIPVLGDSREATSAVVAHEADIVFFAGGALASATQMRRIAWDLEHHDVQVVVAPSVTDVSAERVRIRPVGGLPLMHIDPPRATDASRWGKRLFDVVGAAGLLVLTAPLFLLAAAAIRLHDGGPVLFRQTRVGRHGREFGCLKFRSMVVDAEERLADLQDGTPQDGVLFKLQDDPRVTRPGRWLRRFSVDELPQLLNVLRGDMSLVGPRPALPSEVADYDGDVGRRMHVRPGMTGLWQVSGRSDLSWAETVRLDLYYVDNFSMLQDLSILARTVRAVVGSRGAY